MALKKNSLPKKWPSLLQCELIFQIDTSHFNRPIINNQVTFMTINKKTQIIFKIIRVKINLIQ